MKRITTLFKIVFLLAAIALAPIATYAQSCGAATRTAQDCKFGTPGAQGLAMQNFFSDGSLTAWNFESGAVFQENADGTATLTGVVTQYASSPARSFNMKVNFTSKSKTTTGAPETNNLCPPGSTADWYYYTLASGTLTGISGTLTAGAQLTLSQHMMPSQIGIGGANQCEETNNLGLTGWFEWQIVSQPSNGWLTVKPYPANPVMGQADICIRLSGQPTTCGGGGVTPPVANPDVATTPQNTPVTIASLNNDNLNGGTNAQLVVVTNPSNGTVQVVNGQFVYTPNTGFSGTDVFTYKITASNGTSNTTTVTITVPGTQQTPPIANPDVATTPQNTPVTIASLNNDNLNGGTNAQLVVVTNPSNGTVQVVNGQFVYTPNTGFSGTDVFTYKITASNGTSNTTTVTVTVPSGGGGSDICADPAGNIKGGSGSITITGITTSAAIVQVFNSSWTSVYSQQVSSSSVTVPNLQAGSYIVKVTVLSAGGQWPSKCEVIQTVTVTGGSQTNPPVANPDVATTPQNTPVTIASLNNDNLNGGSNAVLSVVTNPLNGTVQVVNGQFVYTPNTGFSGQDVFTYKITASNGTSNTTTVTVTVTPPTQNPPVANPDLATTPQNTPVTIASLNNDNLNGGSNAVLSVVTNPLNGTVQVVNGQFVYTPNTGFSGQDVFTYKITASNGTSNTTTVTVTVTPSAPICIAVAGTSTLVSNSVTLQNGSALIQGQATNNSTVPNGYSIIYVLTKGDNLTIVDAKPTPSFTVTSAGTYRVHVLVYNPATLNLGIVQLGVTTGGQVNSLLIQGGGTICGSLNVTGSLVTVNPPVVNPCDNDVTPPVFANCPSDIVKTPTVAGSCWTIGWTAPTATDNCSTPTVTQTAGPANNACLTPGTYNVTYTATDAKGNKATCSFKITVNPYNACGYDVTPPVFANCPSDIVKTPTVAGSCWTIGWTAPTATDNCSTPTVTQTAGPANNACLTPGTYNVTYTATDAKGNKATCSFNITVNPYNPCGNDVTPPVFANCPSDIVKTPTVAGSCWTIGWTAPTATDNCSTPTVTQTAGPANNACLTPGTYNVTYTATDAKGNKATCSFKITVNSYTAPCTAPATPAGYMFLGQYGNNFYYKFTGSDCDYKTAKSKCQSLGGHLPFCKDAGEKDFLSSKAGGNMWLGIERSGNGWKYTDGSSMGYTNWSAGEPNNYNGNENCVQMYANGYCNDVNEFTNNWCILVLPCGGGVVTPPVPTCNANFDQNKYYKIVNKKSGKCFDVSGASYNTKANVIEWDYQGGDNQKWSVVPTSGGYCKLIAKHSGKALACSSNWSGAELYQDDYNSSWGWFNNAWSFGNNGDKDWKIECDKDGYKITHKMSGRNCHQGSSVYNGVHCMIKDWDGSDEERFDLVEVSGKSGQNLNNTRILTLSAAAEPNRARIEWINNTGVQNDFFNVEKLNTTTGAFETLANVPTKVTYNMENYVAYDNTPVEGDNFYRINLTYLDGTTHASEVQKLNFKGLAGNILMFPNPVDDVLNLDLSSYKGATVNVFVYNQWGQPIIQQQIEKVGSDIVTLDVSNQQAGTYLVRIATKGKRDVTKTFMMSK